MKREPKSSQQKKCESKIQRVPCGQGNLGGGQVGYRCSKLAGKIVTFPASRPPINFTELSTVQISAQRSGVIEIQHVQIRMFLIKNIPLKPAVSSKRLKGKNSLSDLGTVLRACINLDRLRVESFSYQYEHSVKWLILREAVAISTFSPSCFSFRN